VNPTLADVLALPSLATGRPRVVSGADQLDAPVRWAHVAEVPDVAGLLRGGELVLTTGIGLPRDEAGLVAVLRELAAVPVAALVVELGRTFTERLPAFLGHTARQLGLTLVELRREVAFVDVTEAVHALVLDAQLAELRATQQVHETFTEMSVEGADPELVLRQVARLSGTAVVLENLAHQVLAHDSGGTDPQRLLSRWESRSRRTRTDGRTGWDGETGLLATMVGARGQDWGRLLLARDEQPQPVDIVLVERAAATLALNRLLTRDLEGLERQSHRSLLATLMAQAEPTADVLLRAGALGVPLEGRRLLGMVVRGWPTLAGSSGLEAQARLRDLTEAVAQAVRGRDIDALVGAVDDRGVGVLAALSPRQRDVDVLADLAEEIRRSVRGRMPQLDPNRLVVAAGSLVGGPRGARRSLVEAGQVADAAAQLTTTAPFLRLTDLRLRGLLHLLHDDPRVQTYVERELGALLAHDATTGEDLTAALLTYLNAGRNKSAAAAAAHMSRPAFYERLARLQRVLGADLDDVETCLSLHVALLAHAQRSATPR